MDLNDIRQKVGQLFVIGFQGFEPSDDVKKFIKDNNMGGVIFFDRNISSPAQLGDLTNELQDLRLNQNEPQLFMSIDMEGGRVARLKAPFTQWPAMNILGEIGSASLGFKFAESMGRELLAVGLNLNFSPCVDVLTNPENKVIGDRSFGKDPELVSKMSSSLVRGFLKSGVLPCVKHFPGHGDTLLDSHEDLPHIKHDMARLESVEFIPFKKAFRARTELVMTAHIILEAVDPQFPATLSPKVITDLLKNKLGYRKAVITDDMEMKAVTKHYSASQAAIAAVNAGCTMLLYCHTLETQQEAFEAVVKAVSEGQIKLSIIEKNYEQVVKIKKENLKPYVPVDVTKIAKEIGHPDHLKLSKQIARKEIPAGLAT